MPFIPLISLILRLASPFPKCLRCPAALARFICMPQPARSRHCQKGRRRRGRREKEAPPPDDRGGATMKRLSA